MGFVVLFSRLLSSACQPDTNPRRSLPWHNLQEVRRGSDYAQIYSVAFSRTCSCLAVSSDKGTVHVFSMNAAVRQVQEGGTPALAQVALTGGKPPQGD